MLQSFESSEAVDLFLNTLVLLHAAMCSASALKVVHLPPHTVSSLQEVSALATAWPCR
jgi:hypothetical protein